MTGMGQKRPNWIKGGTEEDIKTIYKNCDLPRATSHVSFVTCRVSPFTGHLSPVSNDNSHSHKAQQKTPKWFSSLPILAIRSSTRSLQSTGKRGFQAGTHTPTSTYRLNRPLRFKLKCCPLEVLMPSSQLQPVTASSSQFQPVPASSSQVQPVSASLYCLASLDSLDRVHRRPRWGRPPHPGFPALLHTV